MRVGTQGLSRPYLKTFVPPFLPTRLTAPGSPKIKYLLTGIDIFSKYAWVVPLKSKQGQELVKSFQKILSSGRKPVKLQTDQGTEFLNRQFQAFLREKDIDVFTVSSGFKASVVESFNRTFKNNMYKCFTAKSTLTYIT